jgi:hypothetical protein
MWRTNFAYSLLESRDHCKVRFNPEPIIYGMSEALLAAEVFFGRLDRNMAKQELDLF